MSVDTRPIVFVPSTSGSNILQNGDFDQYIIPAGRDFIDINSLLGWNVRGGRLGFGSRYNPNWVPRTVVIDLDAGRSTAYSTSFTTNGGLYEISFDWAPFFDR